MKFLLLLVYIIIYSVYAQDTTENGDDTTNTESSTIEPSTVETTTTIPILFLNDDNEAITWSPKSTQSIIVEALEGYKISVNITECSIDGENGDYATITADENANGLFFTYGVSILPSYLFNNNVLFGRFVGTDVSNFTVVFTRLGEELVSTTTELPTTTIILPTPSLNDSSTLLVYLAGRTISEYLDPNNLEPLNLLRNAVGAMAAEYCINENFPLNGSVTSDNFIINYMLACSTGWPNSDSCVQLNFSVPVNLVENTDSLWTGYQMTTAHLQIMWSRYAQAYLPAGTTIYNPPNDNNFKWGIVILVVGTLVFALVLLAIRHYGMKISKVARRRKQSDTASIISSNSDRNSQISLPPHYLQETPALFENAYPMYNPSDKNSEYSEPSYAKSFQYQDYQDLSVEQQENDQNEVDESGA